MEISSISTVHAPRTSNNILYDSDGEIPDSTDLLNLTTTKMLQYIYTKDIILWKLNEEQFHINLPCIYCIIGAIILGVFGNGTALYVFGFKMKKNNSNIFIMWLSFCDFMTCFLLIFEVFDKRLPMYSGNLYFLCKTVRFLLIFSNSAAAFFLLCIAFDRYFKVCKPLKRMSTRNTKRAILTAFLLPLLGGWPMALFHGPEKRYSKYPGVYGLDCADDEQYVGTLSKKIFHFFSVIITFSSIITILVVYGIIFLAIRQWKRKDIGKTSRSQKSSKAKYEEQRKRICNGTSKFKIKRSSLSSDGEISLISLKFSTNVNPYIGTPHKVCRLHSDDSSETDFGHNKSNENVQIEQQESGDSTGLDFTIFEEVNGHTCVIKERFNSHACTQHTSATREIRLSSQKNEKDKENVISQRRNISRTTLMFALVSVLYILSFLPTITVEAMNAFGAIYEADIPYTAKQLVVIANSSYFLNGLLNPLVYLAFNKSYRTEIRKCLK